MKTHTYEWTLATARGRIVAHLRSIHWRDPAVPAVDSVCVQTPQASRGVFVLVDDVVVRR
jgi:hypothetical protein